LNPDPDRPVVAKRKSRFIGELKIEDCKLNISCKKKSDKKIRNTPVDNLLFVE